MNLVLNFAYSEMNIQATIFGHHEKYIEGVFELLWKFCNCRERE